MLFVTKIHISDVKNLSLKVGKYMLYLLLCITGSISFNLIPNLPIFVHFHHAFGLKMSKKIEVSSKRALDDPGVDEKPFYFLSGPISV